ncbi:TRAP transporter substrate-binding protein DctP [Enteractinococcus helveticum]|uniref:C4-dicarboxylate ABC transporter substrate-binding protein n=1 Tax=Enteractinococcus helveticum TaxID=1837282 RepID=A0A1B7M2N0_9MICC|nr:TRAP transporter substrate-binding protein DctP [Enteractinococcus helveticum]OAV62862.1 hypothetical protein A6F49_04165 [Enteractinococcus helveticum]
MKKITGTLGGLAIMALALTACGSGDGGDSAAGASESSVKLQFASYLGSRMPESQAFQWAFDEIEAQTDGAVTVDPVWDSGLLGGPDILPGVSDGRADMGFMTVLYNPAELPLSQMATVPFVTEDPVAVRESYAELYETNEEFRSEWENAGVIPLTFGGNGVSTLGTNGAVSQVEDLEGMTLRATGFTATAMTDADVNVVSIPSPEIYESMQRGMIEGWSTQIFDNITVQSLEEVTSHISEPGIGIYTANAFIIGDHAWEQLSEENQQIVTDIAAQIPEKHQEILQEFDAQICGELQDAGVEVTVWEDSAKEAWRTEIGTSLIDQWKSDVSGSTENADGLWDEFQSLLEKHDSDFVSGVNQCAGE